jgi:hypothetical protein
VRRGDEFDDCSLDAWQFPGLCLSKYSSHGGIYLVYAQTLLWTATSTNPSSF